MTAKANETGNAAGVYAPAAAASGSPEGTPVSLRNLTRAFGATKALDGMSLDIAPGELVALLGPSGCGKTTALRIVAGFEFADSGEVLVNGKDVSGVPAAKRDMGMVFQSYSLFPNMSALDNVGFGLRMRKAAAAQRRRKAAELLDMVGLSAQAGQYPHQLSGGQQWSRPRCGGTRGRSRCKRPSRQRQRGCAASMGGQPPAPRSWWPTSPSKEGASRGSASSERCPYWPKPATGSHAACDTARGDRRHLIASITKAGQPMSSLRGYLDALSFRNFMPEGKLHHFLDRFGKPGGAVADAGILAHRMGLYPGDYLAEWLSPILHEQLGVRTFADLQIAPAEDPGMSLPPDRRYRLVVHTSDITRGELVHLPWDYDHYGCDRDTQDVVATVRASMPIPFFFEPVTFTALPADIDVPRRAAAPSAPTMTVGRSRGSTAACCGTFRSMPSPASMASRPAGRRSASTVVATTTFPADHPPTPSTWPRDACTP